MRFSNFALLAAICAINLDPAIGQSAKSKYTYQPGGETFNGKFLPGPDQWGGQCNDGSTEQTPIAITTSQWPINKDVVVEDYTFDAGTCAFSDLVYGVEDNGVKISYDASVCTPPSVKIPNDPSGISIGLGLGGLGVGIGAGGQEVFGPEAGKTYEALQFHIHSSSEHTIDGETFEAEMHIVHAQAGSDSSAIQDAFDGIPIAGSLLGGSDESRGASVVGFMIKANSPFDNNLFTNLLAGFETVGCGVTAGAVDASVVTNASFNPYDFLDENTCIMNYDGGLTTPSCDEIVEWNLATTPISVSRLQMDRLLALINDCPESVSFNGSTSRPVQPLNARTVNQICPSSSSRRTTRNLR